MGRKNKNLYDVIIIGAGMAGIACAEKLLAQGKKILVLEARGRIGGRACTVNKSTEIPLDLGPEFIHGAPPELLKLFKENQQSFYDVSDKRFFFLPNGKTQELPHFWDDLKKRMKHLPHGNEKDLSVEEFLKRSRSSSKKDLMFKSYVEGFHAADLAKVSAKGLFATEEASDEKDLNGVQLFRPLGGYGILFDQILKRKSELKSALKLNTAIQEIHWNENEIEVRSKSKNSWRAKKIVITVPLGVLKEKIQWHPRPPKNLTESLSSLEMGHIQKITFCFEDRIWEKNFEVPPAFFHTTPDAYFPTWWSLEPMRTHHLVAWQGGPKAFEMASWSEEKRIKVALHTLSGLIRKSPRWLEKKLVSYHTHNWSEDPFSCGAYSYIGVDGFEKSKRLQKPFEGKIYLAGEACAEGAGRGTVHGALRSGLRAAAQVLRH